MRSYFPQVPWAEFDLAWAQSLPAFKNDPRIEAAGMQKNYDFLREAEGWPVNVPIAESYTNAVVEAVAPSMG